MASSTMAEGQKGHIAHGRGAPLKGPPQNEAKQCCHHCPVNPPEVLMMSCGHQKNGRVLIVCIDGTANQFGKKNTNVVELYNRIMKGTGDNQHTWYHSGIGTYARPHWASFQYRKQVFSHTVDLAIAWDFDKTILAGYQWLADNYQDGDCIFLFGFSRGAFQVRVLSGMIDKVGLLYKGNEKQIPFAYELYADPKSDLPEDSQAETSMFQRLKQMLKLAQKDPADPLGKSMAERFKETFSRSNVKVHFVGVWDTVSSIGVVRGKRMLPRTIEGMTHVCHFRQALALDERRVKFQPEYAYGGKASPLPSPPLSHSGPDVAESNTQAERNRRDKSPEQTLEVWFAGTHSDIGGGNANNMGMDRSRPPLRWMASEAEMLGLRLKPFTRELEPGEQIEFQESLTGLWHLFELFPFRRLTFSRSREPTHNTFMPHLWSPRKIHVGQKIHSSLILANLESNESYIPKARPPSQNGGPPCRWLHQILRTSAARAIDSASAEFWNELRNAGLENRGNWLEIDLFDYARILLNRNEPASDLREFVQKYHEVGVQAVYDGTVEAIQLWKEDPPEPEAQHRVLQMVIEILEGHLNNLTLRKWCEIWIPLTNIARRDLVSHRDTAKRFWNQFTDEVSCLFELQGHTDSVGSVSFSPDGARIASGSFDETIRIWDAKTGKQMGEPLRGRTTWVRSVAISPDGKRIVSGSYDYTIRIWDAETGRPGGEPLQGHTSPVFSVAISPDGRHIVSGSFDTTIRIWDEETGEQVREPLQGHTSFVRSVAFSPDGKRIVSGSDDGTIRIWDAEKGERVGEPLRGHAYGVNSVAISPDAKRIVSGAADRTIRIWDLEKGVQVGEPLRGHTSSVRSVAISSDGKYIVSGSEDTTIRSWDLETRVQVGKPLRRGTATVLFIAISPDGKRIASGSEDKTIRIWSTKGILY